MTDAKYTKDGLPVVSENLYYSFSNILLRTLHSGDFGEGEISEILSRLNKENKNIYRFYEYLLKNKNSISAGFGLGMIFTYELLRRQAEANQLEKELGSR